MTPWRWIAPLLLLAVPQARAQTAPTDHDSVIAALNRVVEEQCRLIPPFDPRHAVAEARAEARRAHVYLYGIQGFSTDVVGVSLRRDEEELPVRMIEGAGEISCTDGRARATLYSHRFNRAMLREIRRRKGSSL